MYDSSQHHFPTFPRSTRMAGCGHISWLQSANTNEFQLRNGGWMRQVIQETPNPTNYSTSLIFLVGQKCKNTALQELFPYNNIKRGRQDGFANLRNDNATLYSDRPIWFAESDPFTPVTPTCGAGPCHESTTHPVRWAHPSQQHIFDILHTQLILLMTSAALRASQSAWLSGLPLEALRAFQCLFGPEWLWLPPLMAAVLRTTFSRQRLFAFAFAS